MSRLLFHLLFSPSLSVVYQITSTLNGFKQWFILNHDLGFGVQLVSLYLMMGGACWLGLLVFFRPLWWSVGLLYILIVSEWADIMWWLTSVRPLKRLVPELHHSITFTTFYQNKGQGQSRFKGSENNSWEEGGDGGMCLEGGADLFTVGSRGSLYHLCFVLEGEFHTVEF